MQTKSVHITKSLQKNNVTFFSTPNKKTSKQNAITLKKDVALSSTLFIVSQQQRKEDLSEFFAHENQGQPPSLSLNNNLGHGNKASYVKYFEEHVDNIALPVIPSHDAYMVGGAVIVNAIKPDNGKTFEQYAIEYIIPCLLGCILMSHRLDIIFEVYLTNSLKTNSS